MYTIKILSGNRVTIPAALRKKYGIKPGTKVIFNVEGNAIKIIPAVTEEEVDTNIVFLKGRGNLMKESKNEKRSERKL